MYKRSIREGGERQQLEIERLRDSRRKVNIQNINMRRERRALQADVRALEEEVRELKGIVRKQEDDLVEWEQENFELRDWDSPSEGSDDDEDEDEVKDH